MEFSPQEVLERLPEPIFAFDGEWRLVYANEAAHQRVRGRGGSVNPGGVLCEELPELAGASDRLRRVAELRETAEIELSNSSREPRARVRIFPCGSGVAVQCLDEAGKTPNGNGAGDESHNEARYGASSSEKRVERLRAYLGTLVEATNDAVIGFDEEFNVLSWNRGARNMLGYEEAEIVGRSAYELVPGEFHESARKNHERARGGEELHEYVSRLLKKDGEEVYASVSISPLQGSAGSGYVAVMQDITRRRRAEIDLRESERRFRAVAELVPNLLWSCDSVGETEWFNRRWLEYTGQSLEEALERGWLAFAHPEDRELSRRNFWSALEERRPLLQEHRLRSAAGEYRWFLTRMDPLIGPEGEVVQWFGSATDIHEHKTSLRALVESEERYRTLFDSIDEAFALCELVFGGDGSPVDYRFLEVNPAFETMTGIPPERATGGTARELVPELEGWWVEAYEKVALGGESLRFENYVAGLGRWMEVYASPVGEIRGGRFAVVFQDITGRKNAEAERERLLRREREISLTLQRALLPPSLPEIPGLRVAARYVAASEGMEVGGDLYDVFPLAPERWAMVVGDVTGKGPEAASLTSLAHYTIRTASASEPGPIEVVRRLNEEIVRQTEGLNLMTLIFGELWREGEGWRLELATGGHPPPLVLRAGGAAELQDPGGMLLGASEEPDLGGWSLYLPAGDAIVLYTDGVTEARSPAGEFFGDERLAELGERCARLSAEEIAETVTSEVRGFQNGSPRDDMAVLVLEAVQ